jgi:dihydroorotase
MSHRILITGGRVLDPASGRDEIATVTIEDGIITAIESPTSERDAPDADVHIDASGQWVTPGFIDLRSHLREPGEEWKETVASAARAAVAGGYTAICAMPDTIPVNDEATVTIHVRQQGERTGLARILPVGATTQGLKGETLADMGDMKAAGAVAVSDGDHPVASARMMRRVMEYASTYKLPVMTCSYDASLAEGGVMHEGLLSTRLGLAPIPAAAETIAVARDLELATLTGARVHLGRLSCADSLPLLRAAQKRGAAVTAEVTPHHLTMTETASADYDTNTRVVPPLRSERDRAALVAAVEEGLITCISTDHAPQNIADKELEFVYAAPGMVGLETAFSNVLSLIHAEELSVMAGIRALTLGPAEVLGLDLGRLAVGAVADIAVLDPNATWTVQEETLASQSFNTPLLGQELLGRASATIVGGKPVFGV